MSPVMMTIEGRALPGERDAVFALFQQHLAPRAAAEDGQQLVVWASSHADDESFQLVEIYSDPSLIERNSTAEWFWAYMREVGPLLDGEPRVTTSTPRWAKGTPL